MSTALTQINVLFVYVFWNKRKASLTLITRASEFGTVDKKTAKALSCRAEQSWLGAVLTQPVGDNSLIVYAWALQCPLSAWAILLCLGKGTAHHLCYQRVHKQKGSLSLRDLIPGVWGESLRHFQRLIKNAMSGPQLQVWVKQDLPPFTWTVLFYTGLLGPSY